MAIFIFSQEDSEEVIPESYLTYQEDPDSSSIIQINTEPGYEGTRFTIIADTAVINEDEIEIIEEYRQKKSGLGVLYRARYRGRDVMYRLIKF
mmetsp:Transcript_3530/g.466  ORF Transcript_3530/g.466 Transcript_3530/m.466 type:complete len:93 (+) Transcript_3530:803-1081(+)